MPCSLWNLSSPTRDRICAPAVEVWILTTELPGKSLKSSFSLTSVHYHFPNLGFIDTHTDTHTQCNTHTHPWRAVQHTHTHTHLPTHPHTHTHPPIHTHTHPPTPLHTHIPTHTHTHPHPLYPLIPPGWDCRCAEKPG